VVITFIIKKIFPDRLMKKLILLLSLLLFMSAGIAQNYMQVKIYVDDITDVQKLIDIGLEFDHPSFSKEDMAVTVFITDKEYKTLQSSGFRSDVIIDDWQMHYNSRHQLTQTEKNNFLNHSKEKYNVEGFGFGSMGGYYTLAEVVAELDSMYALYPNLITQKASIGITNLDKPIYMVKISDNPNINEDEPEALYTALTHAREPEGMMTLIYFMYYLLENYNTDASVKYLVDNRELYFIPVVNCDGYEYNRTTNPNGGGMWRKNRSNNGGSYGVDLNRNFGPYEYWNAPNGGSSTTPSSDTYRGTAPFSEPETQAYKNFIAGRYIKNALNYHTYSNLLIFPYGALEMETPDSATFREFARDMTAWNGYEWGTDQQTVGYSTRGNSDDFCYDGDTVANNGKIFAMTPEVGGSGDGFWPAQNRIFPLAQENLNPNLYYAWVAGEYVSLLNAEFNQQYFNPGDVVSLTPTFRNKGLSAAENISVELTSLSEYAIVNNGTAALGSIPRRSTISLQSPFSFTVAQTAPADALVKLLMTTKTGSVTMSTDTVSFIVGVPVFAFSDTTNNPLTLWTITANPSTPKWEATTTSYHTSPNSYTDSKTGNYLANATVTMTLTNPIDLSTYSNPRLSFWTKYELESNWDYGQVEVSTNNGSTWMPLSGNYTEPGQGTFQPNGEPLYDGTRSAWVNEEMNLSNFTSANVKLKFELKSDGSIQKDGWYVDDIGVIVYTVVPVELTNFTAKAGPNEIILNWSTASELNNHGFEIERGNRQEAVGNSVWVKVGFVKGSGTTSEKRSYSFTDNNPVDGKTYYRLKQIDLDGTSRSIAPVEVTFNGVINYALEQNYPNPFNPVTQIKYSIPEAGNVTIKVYNVLGKEVASLINEFKEAGKHKVEFSGKQFGSGIYFYTIKAAGFSKTLKMMLLK